MSQQPRRLSVSLLIVILLALPGCSGQIDWGDVIDDAVEILPTPKEALHFWQSCRDSEDVMNCVTDRAQGWVEDRYGTGAERWAAILSEILPLIWEYIDADAAEFREFRRASAVPMMGGPPRAVGRASGDYGTCDSANMGRRFSSFAEQWFALRPDEGGVYFRGTHDTALALYRGWMACIGDGDGDARSLPGVNGSRLTWAQIKRDLAPEQVRLPRPGEKWAPKGYDPGATAKPRRWEIYEAAVADWAAGAERCALDEDVESYGGISKTLGEAYGPYPHWLPDGCEANDFDIPECQSKEHLNQIGLYFYTARRSKEFGGYYFVVPNSEQWARAAKTARCEPRPGLTIGAMGRRPGPRGDPALAQALALHAQISASDYGYGDDQPGRFDRFAKAIVDRLMNEHQYYLKAVRAALQARREAE